MPQIINRDTQTSQKGSSTQQTAVVNKPSRAKNEPRGISIRLVVAAGALVVLLIVYLVHAYVHPFTAPVKQAHKVAPLPGFPDTPPYNVKEWQDMYKSGKATFVSGIPHVPVGLGSGKP